MPELRSFVNEHKRKPENQKALEITAPQDFEAQISSGTTLINFYTEEHKVDSVLNKLATQYSLSDEVNFFKVNCGQENLQGLCENEEVIMKS